MAVDDELLAAARAAHERLVGSERAADLARAEFRYSVRKLHLAGASLREVGEALNFSHQRVHQLVREAGGGGPGSHGWRSFTGGGGRSRPAPLACSFCGKPRESVGKIIAGPGGVAICDACAAKRTSAVAASRPPASAGPGAVAGPAEAGDRSVERGLAVP